MDIDMDIDMDMDIIKEEPPPSITFTTAWYDLGAKFAKEQYYVWAENLLQNVRKFNLIVYVEDMENAVLIARMSQMNPRIYIIIHPFNDLPLCGQYEKQFIENHTRNVELKGRVSWRLVLLWCSKQYLVELTETRIKEGDTQYPSFATDYYGWMDIGYFRNRPGKMGELGPAGIQEYPNLDKLRNLSKNKIHYALVNPSIMTTLSKYALNRGDNNLPIIPIPANQISIAGGFFILGGGGVAKVWREQFETHIAKYFAGNATIKDDQYVIIDLILMNPKVFELWMEAPRHNIDSWFLFQRLLV